MAGVDRWVRASDPAAVHALLVASDRATAGPDGEVPARNAAGTERAVAAGWVWVLRQDGVDVSMITVSPEWTGSPAVLEHFPATAAPRYMRRLAVLPELHGSGALLSVRTVRKALEIAAADGGTAVRCETNPGDEGAVRVLRAVGFRRCGPEFGAPPRSAVLLHRPLLGGPDPSDDQRGDQ